jgi:hypothetical protein
MPISIEICADTPDELASYIYRLAIGSRPIGTQEPAPDITDVLRDGAWKVADPVMQPVADANGAETSATEDVTESLTEAAARPSRRSRGRPKNTVVTPEGPAEEDPMPAEAAPKANGADHKAKQSDMFEDVSAKDKIAALDLLRTLYDLPDMPGKVNDLLASYNVSKFTLVPDERGTELLRDARKLEAAAA